MAVLAHEGDPGTGDDAESITSVAWALPLARPCEWLFTSSYASASIWKLHSEGQTLQVDVLAT